MSKKRRIYFTVTNDLSYDQRMIRICTSLANADYDVWLVGRKRKHSKPLREEAFQQKRLNCWFDKGKFFYLEYNIRLFFFLLFKRFDAVCSIDLDTIMAGSYAAWFKRKVCIYDAHEYFTEVPEVVRRPRIQKLWAWVARHTVPKLKYCYTVCESIAEIFKEKYKVPFEVVRNVPFHQPLPPIQALKKPLVLLYQGALNEGRGLEEMIQAMQQLEETELWLAGEGDLSKELRQLAKELNVDSKVKFLGYVQPHDLKAITLQADIGLNLLQNKGLNYYYSLANKFFDYIQAMKPSINMNFPEYQRIIKDHKVGLLIKDLKVETLVEAIHSLQKDPQLLEEFQENSLQAREVFIWEKEEQKLLSFYSKIWKT
ncbi:MAG: glycosyltransferase [Saprospiraceae bacterium]|nr:glycosyltransferase [Saprospiraceae bacterium]